jgi:lincosamide nucleotidyltransferase A/C/D/E
MRASDVLEIYSELERLGVLIWIDGGWAVDALVGHVTRAHDDLDIAVGSESIPSLRQFLTKHGYRNTAAEDATDWNFVTQDAAGNKIDVHVVVFDKQRGVHAEPVGGIAYPAGSLTGEGVLLGQHVRCVRADALFHFKLSYPPRDKDREDVAALAALLGAPIPESHR